MTAPPYRPLNLASIAKPNLFSPPRRTSAPRSGSSLHRCQLLTMAKLHPVILSCRVFICAWCIFVVVAPPTTFDGLSSPLHKPLWTSELEFTTFDPSITPLPYVSVESFFWEFVTNNQEVLALRFLVDSIDCPAKRLIVFSHQPRQTLAPKSLQTRRTALSISFKSGWARWRWGKSTLAFPMSIRHQWASPLPSMTGGLWIAHLRSRSSILSITLPTWQPPLPVYEIFWQSMAVWRD